MRRVHVVVLSCLLVVVTLPGCETSCSYSTAKLTDAQMAKSIHPDSQALWETATTFAPEAPAIYATAHLTTAPDDTHVKATFYYLEGSEREIAGRGGACRRRSLGELYIVPAGHGVAGRPVRGPTAPERRVGRAFAFQRRAGPDSFHPEGIGPTTQTGNRWRSVTPK